MEVNITTNNTLHPRLINFKFFHFTTWLTIGCFNPFIVLFLMHRNVNTVTIGFILMINSLVSLIGQPLWGMVSDRIQSVKKVFLFCILTATLLNLILPWCSSTVMLTFMLPLSIFFFCALSPLLDSWTIYSIRGAEPLLRIFQTLGIHRVYRSGHPSQQVD